LYFVGEQLLTGMVVEGIEVVVVVVVMVVVVVSISVSDWF
jgi:hypothetical protein